ncbi:MAG TPA: TrmH family RNA methyltransferase [Gaiellaceae bacterium]|nr:TrmH family RNA methyltransferase [Gaiellaceae bacterium]
MPQPQRQAILTASDEYQLTAALLTNRKQRARQGRFVVQSVKAIESALVNGWEFESVWTPRGRRLSAWASSVIERSGARRHVELAPELFAQLAEKSEPGELVALVELSVKALSEVQLGPRALVVVLDRPSSPGNLGSIIRTAEAFAADAVVVTGHAADLYDPQAVRASLGAIFAIPAIQHQAPAEVAGWLAAACEGLRIVGTSANGTEDLDHVELAGPVALVFGNETTGLSAGWRELCDEVVTIPTSGITSSLNLASAAAVFLNEVRRQRVRTLEAGT